MSSAVIAPFSAIEEMICLLASLTKTVSRYRLISVHLGTSVDCLAIREELASLRAKMLEEVRHSRENFVTSCKEKEIGPEQEEADRLFCVYLAGIELFTQELLRTVDLYKVFNETELLLETGMQDYIRPSRNSRFGKLRKGSTGAAEGASQSFADEIQDIYCAIDEIKNALAELQASVSLTPWTMAAESDVVVPDQVGSECSLSSSDEETVVSSGMSSSGDTSKKKRKRRICCRSRKQKIYGTIMAAFAFLTACILTIIVCLSISVPRELNATLYNFTYWNNDFQ